MYVQVYAVAVHFVDDLDAHIVQLLSVYTLHHRQGSQGNEPPRGVYVCVGGVVLWVCGVRITISTRRLVLCFTLFRRPLCSHT